MNTSGSPFFFIVDDQCPSFQQAKSFDSFQRIVELRDTGCDARKSFTDPLKNPKRTFNEGRENVQHHKRDAIRQRNNDELREQESSTLKNAGVRQKNDTRRFKNIGKQQNVHKESTAATTGSNRGGQTGQQNEISRNNLRKDENERLKRKKPTIVHGWESNRSSEESLRTASDFGKSQESEEETDKNREDERPYLRTFVDRAVDKDSLSSSHDDLLLKNNSKRSDNIPIYYMQGHVKPQFEFDLDSVLKYDNTADIKTEFHRLNARINGSYEGENFAKEHVLSRNGKPDCTDDSKEMQESVAWRNSLRDHLSGDTRTKMSKEDLVRGKVKPQGTNVANRSPQLKKLNNSKGPVIQTTAQNIRQSEKLFPFSTKNKENSKSSSLDCKDTRANITAEKRKIHARKKWTGTQNQKIESHFSQKADLNNRNQMVTKSDEKQATVSGRNPRISNVPIRIAGRKWSRVPSAIFSRQPKIPKDSESEASRRSRTKPITKHGPNVARGHVVDDVPKVEPAATEKFAPRKISNEPLKVTIHSASEILTNDQQITVESMVREPIIITSRSTNIKPEESPPPKVDNPMRELPKLNGVGQKILNMVQACRDQRKRSFAKHGFECDKRRRMSESEELLDIGISVVENVLRQ